MAISIPHAGRFKAAGRHCGHDGGNGGAVNRLQKNQDQRHIRRAGDEKPDGKCQLGALTEGLKTGSHGQNLPAILAQESRCFFFRGFTPR